MYFSANNFRRNFFVSSLLLFSFVFSNVSVAGPAFKLGVQLYYMSKYQEAATSLQKALKEEKSAVAKAKVNIYLGVVSFMLSKKSSAKKYFKEALKLYPKITITPDEVLDESVLALFKSVASSYRKKETPKVMPEAEKPTTVKINSNVRGIVFYRNTEIGVTGELIDLVPGKSTLLIRAPSYKTKKLKVNAKAGKNTVVTVNLVKSKKKLRKSTSKSSRKLRPAGKTWILLLPFGAGQFQNGSYLLGGFAATSQLVSLYLYSGAVREANQAEARVQRIKKGDFDAEFSEDPVLAQQQKQIKYDEFSSFIEERRVSQALTLSIASLFWMGGVIEAYLNRPFITPKKRSSHLFMTPNGGVGFMLSSGKSSGGFLPNLGAVEPFEKNRFSIKLAWML